MRWRRRRRHGRLRREDVLIEWDDEKHGEGTVVMLKSDNGRGVSTTDRDGDGEIFVRFDDGSEEWIQSDDVWVPRRLEPPGRLWPAAP